MGKANGNASTWKISACCIFEFFPQFLLSSAEFELLRGALPWAGAAEFPPRWGEDGAFSLPGLGLEGSFYQQTDRQTEPAAPSEADAFH